MQQETIVPYLKLLCSEDITTTEQASKLIILQSTVNPKLIVQSIHDISFFLKSLTSSDYPKMNAITGIIMALVNALTQQNQANQPKPDLCALVEISQMITQCYFSTPIESSYPPFLLPYTAMLNRLLTTNNLIPPELLLTICDHCYIGFAPNASFIPFMFKMWNSFQKAVIDLRDKPERVNDQLYRLSRPISSPNNDVVIFFLVLWSVKMPELIERPQFIQALAQQSRKILEFVENNTYPFNWPAKYLLACLKSNPPEQPKLIEYANTKKEEFISVLREYMNSSHKAETTESHEAQKQAVQANISIQPIERLDAEMNVKNKRKKFYLYFYPEPKLFAWGPNIDMKELSFLQTSEIESAVLDESRPSKGPTHYILTVTAFKNKEQFKFYLSNPKKSIELTRCLNQR